jgi:membrane dipeptidase
MNIPVFDLHCDTALALLGREFRGEGKLRSNNFHIDLDRAGTLAGYAQCFACFTSTWEKLPDGLTVTDVFEREMSVIHREVEANSDRIRLAYTASDVEENLRNGLMSAILTIEGPAGFGFDPGLLELLYRVGFRISTLGWNENNPLTGSHKTGGGLTDQGREYVRQAQSLGMIVDVSHISDEGFWDIMKITEKPIIASHSNSRAVHDCSRNLTDDMFRAICETGGVAGFNQFAYFIGEKADLDKVCDHFLHFLELDPSGKHIALGGDLDGCDVLPVGFEGVQDYPVLADKLLSRGLTEQMVRDIFWNNALEVMRKCCM